MASHPPGEALALYKAGEVVAVPAAAGDKRVTGAAATEAAAAASKRSRAWPAETARSEPAGTKTQALQERTGRPGEVPVNAGAKGQEEDDEVELLPPLHDPKSAKLIKNKL